MSRRLQIAVLLTAGALMLLAFGLGVNMVLKAEADSKAQAAQRERLWSGQPG
jgi:hypothetical protein